MLRKCFLVPVLATLAFLMVAVDMAQAQRLRERRMERRDVRRGVVTNNYNYSNEPGTTTPGMTGNQNAVVPTVMNTPNARISYYNTPYEGQNGVAQIRVILPTPEAKVFFDDKATTSTGADRLFITPQLTQGQNNYKVRVMFMQNGQELTREQVLPTAPGMTYVVDFTKQR
jgi:uncharacterized protein (TIGR03000 family)